MGTELGLRDLILTLKGDRTYSELERDSGGIVKAQRWNQIANGIRLNEFPEPRTMKAMAQALNIEVNVILLAFAKALGLDIDPDQPTFISLLPPSVRGLTDNQQAALLMTIRAMTDQQPVIISDGDGQAAGAKKQKRRPRGDVPPLA